VRLGFLGAGFIADYHAAMLELSGADAAIVAVYDPDRARAEAFCSRYGGTPVASEHDVISAVDAVYVCTWTSEHVRLVGLVADTGVPVFCEKPLGVDLPAAEAVAATVNAAGLVNQVGLVLRDSPALRLVKAMLDDPTDGEVMAVVFRDAQYLPVQGIYNSAWRGDPARAGSGTLLEHSIHDVDLLEWLLGPVVSLSARTSHVHGIAGIEDVASVTFDFASGATAHLTSVWHDVLTRPSQRRLEVFRQRAWYVVEGDVFGPVRWMRSGEAEGSLEGDALVAELGRRQVPLRFPDAGFIEAVAGKTAAHPTVSDALRAHVVVDAAYRSAAAGGEVVAVPRQTGAAGQA
jgi:predicted dehydrogenase